MSSRIFAYVSPEMLRWARSETPFKNVPDVATKLSLNVEDILAWESGLTYPSITNAKKLAKLYDVPLACFYLPCPPAKKPRPYVDRRTAYGVSGVEISYSLWREIRRIMFNREIIVDLLNEETKSLSSIPLVNSSDSVEVVASTIRDFLNIKLPFKYKSSYGNNAYNFFRDVIEKKGIMVAQITAVDKNEIKALSIFYDTVPIIAVNGKDWERSKVFSLFHEMAHLVRRSSSLCSIDFETTNDSEEQICNSIAAATLLPKHEFNEVSSRNYLYYGEWTDLCLQKIADSFGTSTSVVLRRLYSLKIIDATYFFNRLKELNDSFLDSGADNKNGFPVEYFYKYINMEGRLFPRVLFSAYSRGDVSYGELCRNLNLSPVHIGNVEQAVMYK